MFVPWKTIVQVSGMSFSCRCRPPTGQSHLNHRGVAKLERQNRQEITHTSVHNMIFIYTKVKQQLLERVNRINT